MNPDDVLSTAGGNYYTPPQSEVALGYLYGVGGVGNVGTYTQPEANYITSITNNHDGTYDVTFQYAIATGSTLAEPNVLPIDVATGFFQTITDTLVLSSNVVRWTLAGVTWNTNAWWIDGNPTSITSTRGFKMSPYITG